MTPDMQDSTQPGSGAAGAWYPPRPEYQPGAAGQDPAVPEPRRRARRPVALLVAVAIASGVVGGGTAALIGGATHSTAAAAPVAGAPVSAKSGGSVAAVAAAVGPSVVEITADSGDGQSIGSGVILTADGTILTNNHVVAGADNVKIALSDGRTATANVVATDPSKDLAVIKANGVSGLKAAQLGSSAGLAVGDPVVAIGSPEGLSGTVTSGVVSALNRDVTVPVEDGSGNSDSNGNGNGNGSDRWPFGFGGHQYNGQLGGDTTTYKAIQTDASLNPGNSGGALLNMSGQVIGVNSAMYAPSGSSGSAASGSASGSIGLGFAIPVDTVKAFLDAHHIAYNR
ncbi:MULTISPECIES: S1C family serine protease [Streptomycetaceae]|uniref:Protease n=1 Tax=Streptantibioticus cattleyicolor (strain ATCC 35852 / DSM 46488 / JCM 4925 / NBRC 14057 / NRRL 8057) TaxID=1003195 RepID=F8K144_STREN|nr:MULTISPECIES: trypsin-like peptidase domain-containing protein [Streptomycetaceae]AEW94916.1 protease [Streptantibioticus cattleyicolor NRRL 8057 = DSM 46488]MYS59522.1 trypsin-like serine protease [Streptomyces sp. SID5468]CCB75267.1 putative serine protease [Streptantibioticus cattleyicolor NRRL 8057 = DSM 46488]